MSDQADVQVETDKSPFSSHLQAIQKTGGELIQDVDIPDPLEKATADLETFEAEDDEDEDYDPSQGNKLAGEGELDDEHSAALVEVALKEDKMQAAPIPSSSGLKLKRNQKQQRVPLKKKKKGMQNKMPPKKQKQKSPMQKALRKRQQSQKQQQQKGRRTTSITVKRKNQKKQQKQEVLAKKKMKSVKKTVAGMLENKRKAVPSKTNKAKAKAKVGKRGTGRK